MTVQRAYVLSESLPAERVLYRNGEVFDPALKGWRPVSGTVVTLPGEYERWSDVPFNWIGACPWWPR